MQSLIILEMNEINFEYVESYIQEGCLKNFQRVLDVHGLCKTTSETAYEILEPWIQWVSARTGKTYAEHQVFRLGDIVNSGFKQHWEVLEEHGFSVAAVSPINGANRTKKSPFWVPDPWVDTPASGTEFVKRLTAAVKQAVNDNASEKLSFESVLVLLQAFVFKSQISSWPNYFSYLVGALKKQHWSKAILLDRLLADVYFKLWNSHKPQFSTLFLNSAAHIQHHYMFNSRAYDGGKINPVWYISREADPVLEIYELYDAILGEALKTGARVMVGTGLRQVPYEQVTFYYRLIEHEVFLKRLGASFKRVLPRMSRDFLVECENEAKAKDVESRLCRVVSASGEAIFSVDNRGASLFVTLSYPHEIVSGFKIFDSNGTCIAEDFKSEVAFVAIKNGHHDSIGYFMDSATRRDELPESIPLEDIHVKVMDHFGLSHG